MSKTLPQFTNDIFISYRHNDNKSPGGIGNGWVTEFVNHLTTELESIIKGKVSIYFDKNPHNGLKEHHQINDSLNGRLSSLIFIPVLSQTYCDQTSYAWQNEFIPFLEKSSNDEVGKMVKLQNGNVGSRILPVCIHDLEQEDLRLIESKLNGKLRAINFVYKSPGVNRPLMAHEEDPLKNSNHIMYRDQVNKVANAVREIIASVRSTNNTPVDLPEPKKKNTLLDGLLSTTSSIKSIAVMPLVFKSDNPEDEFLSQGFAEDLFSSLKQIRALRLSIHGLNASGSKVNSGMNSSIAMMTLTGNMFISEDKLVVQVQLKQSKTGNIVWNGEYDCHRDKLFTLRPIIINQICETLSISLRENEIKSLRNQADASPAALELYWKGRFHWRRRGNDLLTSMDCFQKAADFAPGFADAHAGIANAAVLLGYYGMIPFNESIVQCKESALKALTIDPTTIEAYYPLAYLSLCYEQTWPDAEHNFTKVFGINPNSPKAPGKFKNCLTQIICNLEEPTEEPVGSIPYFLHAYSLLHKGKFEEGLKVAQIAITKESGSFMAHRAVGLCYLSLGYEKEAINTLNVAAQLSNRHPLILFDLIGAYATQSNNEEAQSIMEEAMELVNALPARINDFYFQSI